MTVIDVVLIAMVLILLAWRLSTAAGRLDRTHVRRDRARRSLFLQLASRTSATARLITAGALSPVDAEALSREIEKVAFASQDRLADYISAESDLTQVLCEVLDSPEKIEEISSNSEFHSIIVELSNSCKRVALARRFHNDAVGAAQLLHKRKAVRYLRLAGNTPMPQPIDMDDVVPVGLEEV
jgi:hypothetical protein